MDRQAEQPDPEIGVGGVTIQGLNSLHGPVVVYFLFGLIRHETAHGPGERVGLGSLTDMSAFGQKRTFG